MKTRRALLVTTLGLGLMLTLALVLWTKMPGTENVALAAPPEQEPGCTVDVEGKTPDEVLAELEACVAQSGGIGALYTTAPLTEVITMTKLVMPEKRWLGESEVLTFTISISNTGTPNDDLVIFQWRDWLPMDGPGCFGPPCQAWPVGRYIAHTTDGPAIGVYDEAVVDCSKINSPTCTISYTAPTVAGVGWLLGGQSVDITITYEITACWSTWTGNYIEAWDALYEGDWWAAGAYVSDTVDLALESVTITKTAEPEGRVVPSDTITYTIFIDNYGCDNIGVIIADDVLTQTGLCFDWSKGLGSGWWVDVTGGGVFSDTGTNYPGENTFTTPVGTVTKTDFLHWEAYISPTTMVTLTIPVTVCGDYEGNVVTNTAEVWLWDQWWEDEAPPWWPYGTHQFDIIVTNQVGGGVFLPIIMKNYSAP
jgi:hypothetical protein